MYISNVVITNITQGREITTLVCSVRSNVERERERERGRDAIFVSQEFMALCVLTETEMTLNIYITVTASSLSSHVNRVSESRSARIAELLIRLESRREWDLLMVAVS